MNTLKELVAICRLEAIDVVRCHWERAHPSTRGPLSWAPQLQQHLNLNVLTPDPLPPGGAAFLCVMHAKWSPTDNVDTVVAAAEVHIRVAYAFADDTIALSAALAKELGSEVALHHAWPHLRHRLQLVCMELGINAVLLPLKPLRDAAPHPTPAAESSGD